MKFKGIKNLFKRSTNKDDKSTDNSSSLVLNFNHSNDSIKDKISSPISNSTVEDDKLNTLRRPVMDSSQRRSSQVSLQKFNQNKYRTQQFGNQGSHKVAKSADLSKWHSSSESDEDDDVVDINRNNFNKHKFVNKRSVINYQQNNSRHNNNSIYNDNDNDNEDNESSDDSLPLSQLRSKSQVSLVKPTNNNNISQFNKSTPSLNLKMSSNNLKYRKPPPPIIPSDKINLNNNNLSPNYQRQHNRKSTNRQSYLKPQPPPSPAMSMHSAPGGSFNFNSNPYFVSPGINGIPALPSMPFATPSMFPAAAFSPLPTPPPSTGSPNELAWYQAQAHAQAMLNAKQSFQTYVAQQAAIMAGQQWEEEHSSQIGGQSEYGFPSSGNIGITQDSDYYLRGTKSDYGNSNNKRSSKYTSSRYSQQLNPPPTIKNHYNSSLSPPPRPSSFTNYSHRPSSINSNSYNNGNNNNNGHLKTYSASSIPKHPTKLRSQSTLSMR